MTERVAAVIVAAGRSRRMSGPDKLWIDVNGAPLLAHTVTALAAARPLDQVVLVTSASSRDRVNALREQTPWNTITAIVLGGAERADSVYHGLAALQPCDLVLIHDGARPCVTPRVITDGLAAAREHGAAVPALPLADTVKAVDRQGFVVETPDRSALRTVQTPQVFRYELLMHAYAQAGRSRANCTDDAMLLERLGIPVATFAGDPRNIKVSIPDDLPLVRFFMSARTNAH